MNIANENIVLTAASPRKRGFTRMAVNMIGVWVMLGLVIGFFGGLESLFKGHFSSLLTVLGCAAGLGGAGFYYYKSVLMGTTPSKRLLGMRVLKYDEHSNAYRACTTKEILIHETCAAIYFPVSFALMAGPSIFLGALSASFVSGTRSMTDRNALDRLVTEHKTQAAATAGAAAGAGFSIMMLKKYPGLFVPHNRWLSTIVVNADKKIEAHFDAKGTWSPGGKIVNFYADQIEVIPPSQKQSKAA